MQIPEIYASRTALDESLRLLELSFLDTPRLPVHLHGIYPPPVFRPIPGPLPISSRGGLWFALAHPSEEPICATSILKRDYQPGRGGPNYRPKGRARNGARKVIGSSPCRNHILLAQRPEHLSVKQYLSTGLL